MPDTDPDRPGTLHLVCSLATIVDLHSAMSNLPCAECVPKPVTPSAEAQVRPLSRPVCRPAPFSNVTLPSSRSGSCKAARPVVPGCWLAAVPAYQSTQLCAIASEPDQFFKSDRTAAPCAFSVISFITQRDAIWCRDCLMAGATCLGGRPGVRPVVLPSGEPSSAGAGPHQACCRVRFLRACQVSGCGEMHGRRWGSSSRRGSWFRSPGLSRLWHKDRELVTLRTVIC